MAAPPAVALRKESVDRNAHTVNLLGKMSRSLSARRAWIEIYFTEVHKMDANVALRKESVDRNSPRAGGGLREYVALRKESVDRNMAASLLLAVQLTSLSARRAWIEISIGTSP